MQASAAFGARSFTPDIRQLFYVRTLHCLWMGAVFFSLFSLLDFVCCREQFPLFLVYRAVFVSLVLLMVAVLHIPTFKAYAEIVMGAAMLLGTATIAMMTVHLEGFASGYYVGILLMIAGGFSVLPLSVKQAVGIGLAMYAVYMITVCIGTGGFRGQNWVEGVSNTFFFLSIVAISSVQCFDDLLTQLKSWRTKYRVEGIHTELAMYTENLEALVSHRVDQLEESVLRFRDLYENILDMVFLIEDNGRVRMVNRRCEELLGMPRDDLYGREFGSLLRVESDPGGYAMLLERLRQGDNILGMRGILQADPPAGPPLEVELSGNRVELGGESVHYQLIVRDITQRQLMERQVLASEKLVDDSRQAAIFGLARLAECRDDDTGAHLSRIREYTRILAEEMALDPTYEKEITRSFIEHIYRSAVLHDIGKVGISDAILRKPGKLTAEEFNAMKSHCEYGSATLQSVGRADSGLGFLAMAGEIALCHHEWWDGSGYPQGLAGMDIPLAARIVALADVYDALTSSRTYKPAMTHEQAKEMITMESGSHFDPAVVNAFLRCEDDFKASRRNLLLN